jgi:peptide/nickel transport system substrate-binding protein
MGGLVVNPNEQQPGVPWNPFTDVQIREALNWLIDRDRIVQDVYGGSAAPLLTPFAPGSADYLREPILFTQLEQQYAADFTMAENIIDQRMVTANATIGASGFWEDSSGRVVDLKILARIEDERLDIGNYVAEQLRAIDFQVTVVPSPSSVAIPLVYGGNPSLGDWHIYTEGWATSRTRAFDDEAIQVFHACQFEPFCAQFGPPGTYWSAADFDAASEDLASGRYGSEEERQALIRYLTPRILSEANYRMWLVVEEHLFAANDRLERFVVDSTGGPWTPFTLKSAKLLPGEAGVDFNTGLGGELRVLNFIAFNDAWNPWTEPGWRWDVIQRRAIGDIGMWLHPQTGRWIDVRVETSVETAGPTGSMPVPTTAIEWNNVRDANGTIIGGGTAFAQVGAGVTATTKVTTTIDDWGKWHNGMDITMDDVVAGIAGDNRRAFGDVSDHDSRAAGAGTKFFYENTLKGIEIVDDNTIASYIDFWHIDDAEMAAAGFFYLSAEEAPVPWEIQEAALQSVINDDTVINERSCTLRPICLDLGRNPASIAAVDTAYAAILAENGGAGRIPQGMESWITQAEAMARYAASADFRESHGHWYASNGPFELTSIDASLKLTVMTAFREGYPFPPDKWDHVISFQGPEVDFGPFPDFLIGGTGAILPFSTNLDGEPSDPQAARWFLRKPGTNLIPLSGAAARVKTGEYEVQLLSTITHGLESGDHELFVIVTGTSGSVVNTFPLEVTSQFDFLMGLIEDIGTGHPLPYHEIAADVGAIQAQIEFVNVLAITALLLTVAALVLGLTLPILVLRRLRWST